jgi:oxalate decarboxylase/phosphoglucose isomerase-like protein (cupin superfamily)
VLEIEPGAMRQLHWHPRADEWQYYLEGAAEMAVYLGRGHAVTEQFVAGDIGYVPVGAGHDIRDTGIGILRLLLGFNFFKISRNVNASRVMLRYISTLSYFAMQDIKGPF